MHKRALNELQLDFIIEPRGPILIKSGRESGADPTLLDMNFVRLDHVGLGRSTVYLPGSSLKGTVRSYCEKVARTLADDHASRAGIPLSCNPLGNGDRRGRPDYACGKYADKHKLSSGPRVHKESCPICRTFGHTHLAGHLRMSDAYPWDPDAPDALADYEAANRTGQRDGVAIDRVSGAVAVGPFQLEVVTRGRFYGRLTLRNFQLWQVGLLAIALRDIARERVPIGFGKSRGLGRVTRGYRRVEIGYPGRFSTQFNDYDLRETLMGVTGFMDEATIDQYDYRPEALPNAPEGGEVVEEGEFGRVALAWKAERVEDLFKTCVPFWSEFVSEWGRG